MITLSAEFAVTVDLPANRKGSDLSRNAELLAELVDRTVTNPVASLEDACLSIARELLVRHTYATESKVVASAEYFLTRGISPERQSFENYRLLAEATATRDPGRGPAHPSVGGRRGRRDDRVPLCDGELPGASDGGVPGAS